MTSRFGGTALVGLLVVVLLIQPAGAVSGAERAMAGPGADGTVAQTAEEDQLIRTTTLSLLPDSDGVVRAVVSFSVPDQIVELTTGIPRGASVAGTDGFEATGDGNYSWDEETARPSVTLTVTANRTGVGERRLSGAESGEGYTFVDAGNWALVSVPSAGVWWSSLRSESRVEFVGVSAVDGEGTAGDRMAFLGPQESETRTIDGQSVTVVVPEAASLQPQRGAIFDALETAAPGLPESPVERSLLIAAPTSVDWGPGGLADGSDAWVRADSPLDVPGNVWLHEFVHLRQDFKTTSATRWLGEGMAEYYAALFTIESGDIGFERFADHLERGATYDDAVLSQPDTWTERVEYAKGALVFGRLDESIRAETDAAASTRQVFVAMNRHDGPVEQAFVEREIADAAGETTAEQFLTHATSGTPPTMWTATEHAAAFGTEPARFETELDGPLELSGSYRNLSTAELPELVTGEHVTVPVTITNGGEALGSYELRLTIDSRVAATANGTLDGGTSTTETLSVTVREPDERTISIDDHEWSVIVSDPASPVVTALSVDRNPVAVDEPVTVTARIENRATIPANGTVTPKLDETRIATWPVRLGTNDSVERSVTVRIDGAGLHRIAAGDESVDVEAVEETVADDTLGTARSTEPGTSGTKTPGFGLPIAMLGLLAGGWIRARSG